MRVSFHVGIMWHCFWLFVLNFALFWFSETMDISMGDFVVVCLCSTERPNSHHQSLCLAKCRVIPKSCWKC